MDAIEHSATDTTVWTSNDDIKLSASGGMNSHQPQHYLNIWIGNLDSLAGYATYPNVPSDLDGIVMDYRYLTGQLSHYTEGKTLTHLIGNYLGLKDLWNDSRWCGDDGVADTPIHNAPNYMVPNSSLNRHVSLCSGVPQEMLFNFMDATDDEYQRMFTQGQVTRMKAVLAAGGPREALKDGVNVCPAPAPLVENEENDFEKSNDSQAQLHLYPNPSKEQLNIQFSTEVAAIGVISIFNSTGTEIYRQSVSITKGEQIFEIDIAHWMTGFYTLHIQWNGQQLSDTFIR